MSQTYSGVIQKVFNKNGRWSLLMDDDNWYGFNRTKPVSTAGVAAEDGDKAKFSFEFNKQYRNVVEGTLQLQKGSGPAPRSNGGKGKGGSDYQKKEQYWADKELRDIETQKRIGYAGALNTSIALISAALDRELLKFTGKEKYAAFQAMVVEEADALYKMIQNVPANYDELVSDAPVKQEKLPDDMDADEVPADDAPFEDEDNGDWT